MSSLKLNNAGIVAVLNSGKVRAAVDSRARAVASGVGTVMAHDGPVPVEVDSYTSDRPVAGVTLAHPGGIGLEAEYGYLTDAAIGAGLELGRKR
ncbi:hypothetical protein SEA_BARNSTORMER_9 [Microbacterium phage Barnstormer]|uniref:Uncharacterized protein n=1 Tax=Microbacterium phage Barnstormer TaxID=3028491 RepID=A0AAE9ZND9_9CAUD|nr:hypothetical protein SEA_BARNSTORMER_9 [Microbacterium phage Barnstormer]